MYPLIAIFLAQILVFGLASINQRATSKYRMVPTLVTDGGIALVGFTVIKWVAEASTFDMQIAYVLGSVIGSYIGMKMTELW